MYKVVKGELIWHKTKKLPSLKECSRIGIDVETYDPNLLKVGPGGYRGKDGYICGICYAGDNGKSGYIPLRHPDTENFDIKEVRDWFNEMFTGNQLKIGANIMYDLEWLDAEGFIVDGPLADIQIAEPLLDEYKKTYNLFSLSLEYLEDIFWKQSVSMAEMTKEYLDIDPGNDARQYIYKLPDWIVGPYGEMDAIASLKIYEKQEPLLAKEGLTELFELECRLLKVVLQMRKRGVRVNVDGVEKAKQDMMVELKKVNRKIKKLIGWEIESLNSGDQLGVAYDKLGIQYEMTPKSGKPSITKGWLEKQNDPFSSLVLLGRRYTTAINTFLNGSLGNHLVGDRIHCQYHTMRDGNRGTISGRFSCSNPNPQQIPGREEAFANIIRALFIPDPDERWWKIDWSQIEYRFIVHYACKRGFAGAKEARDKYQKDPTTDFHDMVAEMLGMPRKPAKNINFGVAYGMGKNSLKASLGMSGKEANEFLKKYDQKTPFMKLISQDVERQAKKKGYVRTILGRKARFDLWEPMNNYKTNPDHVEALFHDEAIEQYGTCIVRAKTYTALNRVIQGSAADLLKKTMVDSYEAGVYDVIGIPTLTIHDELDGSMPFGNEADEGLKELIHIMNTCLDLEVPIMSDAQIGTDWWNLEKF